MNAATFSMKRSLNVKLLSPGFNIRTSEWALISFNLGNRLILTEHLNNLKKKLYRAKSESADQVDLISVFPCDS